MLAAAATISTAVHIYVSSTCTFSPHLMAQLGDYVGPIIIMFVGTFALATTTTGSVRLLVPQHTSYFARPKLRAASS